MTGRYRVVTEGETYDSTCGGSAQDAGARLGTRRVLRWGGSPGRAGPLRASGLAKGGHRAQQAAAFLGHRGQSWPGSPPRALRGAPTQPTPVAGGPTHPAPLLPEAQPISPPALVHGHPFPPGSSSRPRPPGGPAPSRPDHAPMPPPGGLSGLTAQAQARVRLKAWRRRARGWC